MEQMNVSLAGCGFLGMYHIGVASCFKEYAPHLLYKIAGASMGAIAGCCLLTDVSLGVFTSEMLQMIYEVRSRTFGPFNPLTNVQTMLQRLLAKHLPKDAHKTINGRLFVSMTRILDGQNVLVSQFNSDEELISALLCSAFVPFFSGFIPPKFRGYRCIDGGFSNNLPVLDENTITVSPFCGESDICPRDTTIQLFHINLMNSSFEVSRPNIYRFGRVLFPPGVDVLSKMCKQGFDDALKFLQRNNLISCTKCLTIQRTILLPMVNFRELGFTRERYDPECEECTHHIKKAAASDLPDVVLQSFENSLQEANRELADWISRHKGMKIVSVLSVPYVLTVDVITAVLKKFMEVAPEFVEISYACCQDLLRILINTLKRMNKTGLFLASKVFGPLSVSIYIDEKGNIVGQSDAPRKNTVNVEFNYDPKVKIDKFEEKMFQDSETLLVHQLDNADVHDDTFEHLLKVINHQEAVMAYYYMDNSNKMNLVEFIDVTNDDQIVGKFDENDVKIIASISDQVSSEDSTDTSELLAHKHTNIAASLGTPNTNDDVNNVCSQLGGTCEQIYVTSDSEQLDVAYDSEKNWSNSNKDKFENNTHSSSDKRFRKKSLLPEITEVMVN